MTHESPNHCEFELTLPVRDVKMTFFRRIEWRQFTLYEAQWVAVSKTDGIRATDWWRSNGMFSQGSNCNTCNNKTKHQSVAFHIIKKVFQVPVKHSELSSLWRLLRAISEKLHMVIKKPAINPPSVGSPQSPSLIWGIEYHNKQYDTISNIDIFAVDNMGTKNYFNLVQNENQRFSFNCFCGVIAFLFRSWPKIVNDNNKIILIRKVESYRKRRTKYKWV